MCEATKKMIAYATGISEVLGIQLPDSKDYAIISYFISHHQPDFRKEIGKASEINKKEKIKKQVGVISKEFINVVESLEKYTGIYFFWNNEQLVYIGKSIDARRRILESLEERLQQVQITHCSFVPIDPNSVHIEEMVCISHYKPLLNFDGKTKKPSDIYKPTIDIRKLYKIKISE
jgi:hypothetical protein